MNNKSKPATNQQPLTDFKALLSANGRPFLIVLILGVLINLAGINTRFFTNDPGLYGLLAKTMVQNHNYTDLIYRGADWLDKPHFPFWVTALSFNLFGFTTFAYKLPALLFFYMSVVYTFKFTRKFYGFETGLIAAIILLTSQHVVMSNTDVRAEPYIMGLLMGSIYHFYKVKERFATGHLLLASLFAACAVMTKGIYLLIPIGAAIIGDYVFKKDYKGLLQWRWLLAILLVAVFTLPEIYTLYNQFDLHPEKVVFNRTGVSGIHWFLWDSQFGRFNNSGYITRPDRDYFFFLHTLLWAFAPWAFLLYYALFLKIKSIVKGVTTPEYVALSGAVTMLLIFSISQFQLPFYTNILFPFFAIITATYVRQVFEYGGDRFYSIIQQVIIVALMLLLVLLLIFFGGSGRLMIVPVIIGLNYFVFGFEKKVKRVKLIYLVSACTLVLVNFYIVAVVYPELLKYKGDVSAAEYINTHPELYDGADVIAACEVPDPFEFYAVPQIKFISLDLLTPGPDKSTQLILPPRPNSIILVDDAEVAQMDKDKVTYRVIQKFDNYPNENLTLPFLIEKKRHSTLNHFLLIRLGSDQSNHIAKI